MNLEKRRMSPEQQMHNHVRGTSMLTIIGAAVSAGRGLCFLGSMAMGVAISCAADGAPQPGLEGGWEVLACRNGDRLKGHLLERTGKRIVFQSERFGKITVAASEATVVPAGRGLGEPDRGAATVQPPPLSGDGASSGPRATAAPARQRRGLLGAWKGRLAFSTELVSDSKDRTATSVDLRLQRKGTVDDVQVNARYNFNEAAGTTTSDVVILGGSWRRDLSRRIFPQYRPTAEWNRAAFTNHMPSDYLLSQQEVGAGVTALNGEGAQLRLGGSENLFDVWNLTEADSSHTSMMVNSVFLEAEWKIPWRFTVTERGVWYNRYPFDDADAGWENYADINKKLTDTMDITIRHEIRRNNPNERVQDYSRLRLLFGLDF